MRNGSIVKWEDINIGDKMADGSIVTELHPIHDVECYTLTYGSMFKKTNMTLSADHILLCNISKMDESLKNEIIDGLEGYKIPKTMDYKITSDRTLNEDENKVLENYLTGKHNISSIENLDIKDILNICTVEEIIVEYDDAIVSNDLVWLSVRIIANLINYNSNIECNNNKFYNTRYAGIRKARCIATDTGKYIAKSLIHHNSVAIRNIIFHSLTHNAEMSIGLIDLKQTEFSYFKGKNGVVGVANEVQEAVELLRVARTIMHRRNKEMAKLGITDMADFVPKEPTDIIWVSGRDLHEDQTLNVRIDGEEKEMSAKDLLEHVEKI